MRKISFKLKITLWYTILMTVLVAGLFLFLFSTTRYYTMSSMQKTLREVVAKNAGVVEYDENGLEIEDGFEAYEDGIYLSIFDENEDKIFGTMPSGLTPVITLQDDVMQQVKSNQVTWYVYDLYCKVNDTQGVWLRGITSQAEISSAYHNALMILLLIFPVFILLAGVLGYFFTSRALQPVRIISCAAEKISTGNDLSIRIPHKIRTTQYKNDELSQMTYVFNQMLDRLEQAFEHEKQFTADASHELRTPATVIISQAECAISQAESLEEAKESLEGILKQGKKMSRLITQLLTLSQEETKRNVLELEEVNLSELVEMVLEEMGEISSKKNIVIRSEIQEDICVLVDETLMMRLWINLVSNAIQYGVEGGMVEVALSENGQLVTGTVRDNGIGIAKENLNRIWERFYQVDPARNNFESGSMGLGLSMVKWIVESHGGSIQVQSEEGKGTIFTLILKKEQKHKINE